VWLEGLGQLKNPMTITGNRIRDLPACSIVPQPTTLPRAQKYLVSHVNFVLNICKHSDGPKVLRGKLEVTISCIFV
jgi:hypothetical protein